MALNPPIVTCSICVMLTVVSSNIKNRRTSNNLQRDVSQVALFKLRSMEKANFTNVQAIGS